MIPSYLKNIPSTVGSGFLRCVTWRERHIKEKTFVSMLALVVGERADLPRLPSNTSYTSSSTC